MPVIAIPIDQLNRQLGKPLPADELVQHLRRLGCDVDGYTRIRRYHCARCGNLFERSIGDNPPIDCSRCGSGFAENPATLIQAGDGDVIRIELLPVRPDLFDAGGLARALKQFLEPAPEPPRYTTRPGDLTVIVDPALHRPGSYRPSIACAVIRGFVADDEAIRSIMRLQEDLHWALGRNRKLSSIGVYDLGLLQGERFHYLAADPDQTAFVPLGFDPARPGSRLSLRQILDSHRTGRTYAHLLEGFSRYPLLVDECQQVLSMPPIINAEAPRVTKQTRDIFVDVTGLDDRIVSKTLNIVVTSIHELSRASVGMESVTIQQPDRSLTTPDFSPQQTMLNVMHAARLIGMPLDADQIKTALLRMGHLVTTEPAAIDGPRFWVSTPAYRNDILHEVDLIEDIAIAIGFAALTPALVPTMTVGQANPTETAADFARQALVGLGYLEAMTLPLSSEFQAFQQMRLAPDPAAVLIDNPISNEQTLVRTSLLPGLLELLTVNKDQSLPQQLFEVSTCSRLHPTPETGVHDFLSAAAVSIGDDIGFADGKRSLDALARELKLPISYHPLVHPSCISGRCAEIRLNQNAIGLLGEIHPELLTHFDLLHPAVMWELSLNTLVRRLAEK